MSEKTIKDLIGFMEANIAQWSEELASYPEAKAVREGGIQSTNLYLSFLTEDTADPLTSDTDAEEAAAERI